MNRLTGLALLLALAGCGSSGHNPSGATGAAGQTDSGARDTAGSAGIGGGSRADADAAAVASVLTWKENGLPRSATSSVAQHYVSSTGESLGILATDPTAHATISMIVSAPAGSTLGGTYACGTTLDGGPATTALSYDNQPVPQTETCTITVTFGPGGDGTPHVMGTFEATLPMTATAGAITLTDGSFDLPVMQFGG